MTDAVYIAGIGFSAGGLDPLRKLFDCTLHDSVTYVIVQHLPVNYRTNLALILASHSSLKIMEVEDNMPVSKDAIYVTPPSSYIELQGDRFRTIPRPSNKPFPNESVDKFFSSLATTKRDKSIGIVLSGGGEDGLNGSRLIKQAGGLVIVQDPAEASHASMPETIRKHHLADFVVTASNIPEVVRRHVDLAKKPGSQSLN